LAQHFQDQLDHGGSNGAEGDFQESEGYGDQTYQPDEGAENFPAHNQPEQGENQ